MSYIFKDTLTAIAEESEQIAQKHFTRIIEQEVRQQVQILLQTLAERNETISILEFKVMKYEEILLQIDKEKLMKERTNDINASLKPRPNLK